MKLSWAITSENKTPISQGKHKSHKKPEIRGPIEILQTIITFFFVAKYNKSKQKASSIVTLLFRKDKANIYVYQNKSQIITFFATMIKRHRYT